MPITLNTDSKDILTYLGIEASIIATFLESYKLVVEIQRVSFLNAETKESVGVLKTGVTLSKLIASKKLTAQNKALVKDGVLKVINKLANPEEYNIKPDASELVFDVSKMKSAQPVKLRDATMLYQPVYGSSAGSRYFCVASRDDLKIAARYASPSTLSVRCEGTGLTDYSTKLKLLGLTGGSEHMSIHLGCEDKAIAYKALGAILFGLGLEFNTPMPVPSVVIG